MSSSFSDQVKLTLVASCSFEVSLSMSASTRVSCLSGTGDSGQLSSISVTCTGELSGAIESKVFGVPLQKR